MLFTKSLLLRPYTAVIPYKRLVSSYNKVAFVGAGKMAEALIQPLVRKEVTLFFVLFFFFSFWFYFSSSFFNWKNIHWYFSLLDFVSE